MAILHAYTQGITHTLFLLYTKTIPQEYLSYGVFCLSNIIGILLIRSYCADNIKYPSLHIKQFMMQ